MRERINISAALRLYHVWRNWREVAKRLLRRNGMPFTADAVQKAVRNFDRKLA